MRINALSGCVNIFLLIRSYCTPKETRVGREQLSMLSSQRNLLEAEQRDNSRSWLNAEQDESSQSSGLNLDRKIGKFVNRAILSEAAGAIRGLAIDAVKKAGSGHAGTPMGCAEIGSYLYGSFLRYDKQDPNWIYRDRFILSAGHASMLQYACLHFRGWLPMEEIKMFRQLNSKTPSHPQYRLTPGIETTTGLDGQGIAHGVGQALGLKLLSAKTNSALSNPKVVVLAGDGCFMEGISHEASSLAGHLCLDNLIIIYDRNKTCLDGLVSDSCSEDTRKRYEAYGFNCYEIDGHDLEVIDNLFSDIRREQKKPVLIIANTMIGKGAATLEGSYLIHSNPLDELEQKNTKQKLFLPENDFFVPEGVYEFFQNANTMPPHSQHVDLLPSNLEEQLTLLSIEEMLSGRQASHRVLNFLGKIIPNLYGGSADLARSDMTHMDAYDVVAPGQFSGKNIKYGVREFAMGGIAIGLAQTGIIPFVGTFLAFSDYMLSAIRMAALMELPIVYQLTHDSFFIGQDGPTHQPVEQIAHLRSIPGLLVLRPADSYEVKMAWLAALKHKGPSALILSKQKLDSCLGTVRSFAEGVGRGAYVLKEAVSPPQITLIATGSEVSLALKAAALLEERKIGTRVVSMPSWELFEKQTKIYQQDVLGSVKRVSIEAGSEMGWHKYVLEKGKVISFDRFGKSATGEDLAKNFGFTPESIVRHILCD